MSQSLIEPASLSPVPEPPLTAAPSSAGRRAGAPQPVLSLHGLDPETGRPVTWHVTSLALDGAPGTYLMERVDGEIHNPAVWMQAQRTAATVGEDDVIALVREVVFGPAA